MGWESKCYVRFQFQGQCLIGSAGRPPLSAHRVLLIYTVNRSRCDQRNGAGVPLMQKFLSEHNTTLHAITAR